MSLGSSNCETGADWLRAAEAIDKLKKTLCDEHCFMLQFQVSISSHALAATLETVTCAHQSLLQTMPLFCHEVYTLRRCRCSNPPCQMSCRSALIWIMPYGPMAHLTLLQLMSWLHIGLQVATFKKVFNVFQTAIIMVQSYP